MLAYKAPNDSKPHFIETVDDEYRLPLGSVRITDAEAAEMLKTPPLNAEQINALADADRAAAYRTESDPLFFKFQRGEATKEEWLASIEAIKERYPKV